MRGPVNLNTTKFNSFITVKHNMPSLWNGEDSR